MAIRAAVDPRAAMTTCVRTAGGRRSEPLPKFRNAPARLRVLAPRRGVLGVAVIGMAAMAALSHGPRGAPSGTSRPHHGGDGGASASASARFPARSAGCFTQGGDAASSAASGGSSSARCSNRACAGPGSVGAADCVHDPRTGRRVTDTSQKPDILHPPTSNSPDGPASRAFPRAKLQSCQTRGKRSRKAR